MFPTPRTVYRDCYRVVRFLNNPSNRAHPMLNLVTACLSLLNFLYPQILVKAECSYANR